MEVLVNSVYLGDVEDSGVFRLDLSTSGLSTIQSIILEDDNVISGGTGAASGFDLDMIKLSTTLVSDPDDVAALPGLDVFTFDNSKVLYQPGFLQPWSFGDAPSWNQNQLFGNLGGTVNFPVATLGTLDGVNNASIGGVSLGEGGAIGFSLNAPVSTTGLYLYVADVGGGNDSFRLKVSPDATLVPRTGITLIGTEFDDVIDLSQGSNGALGFGNDDISGGDGDDSVASGAGNDIVKGDRGSDVINGGAGNDICQGFDGDDLINGGADSDTMTGGLGFDQFVFDIGVRFKATIAGIDTITDFTRGEDKIVLDLSTFKRLKSLQLKRSDFEVVDNKREAKASTALFTYIPSSGALFYNENREESGFGKGGQFADLTNGLKLNVKSCEVIA